MKNQRNFNGRQVLRHCLRTKKAVEYERDDDTNCNWHASNDYQKLGKKNQRTGNRGTNRDNLNYIIVDIDQCTEKSPGDLRIFSITGTPVKDHQLTLM